MLEIETREHLVEKGNLTVVAIVVFSIIIQILLHEIGADVRIFLAIATLIRLVERNRDIVLARILSALSHHILYGIGANNVDGTLFSAHIALLLGIEGYGVVEFFNIRLLEFLDIERHLSCRVTLKLVDIEGEHTRVCLEILHLLLQNLFRQILAVR